MNDRLDEDGFCIVEGLINADQIEILISDFESQRAVTKGNHSLRNVHKSHAVLKTAHLPSVFGLSKDILGNSTRLVRAIYFDKLPGANWSVPWHQDLTIAVQHKVEVEGFSPWSQKDGVWHVQPPANILEQMVTIRIHLDDCGPENGPVRVKPGSHRLGRLPESRIQGWNAPEVPCVGKKGSALVMRPLLLHASSPAASPSHRRVLHLEYAGVALPAPLRWYLEASTSREEGFA